MALGGPNIYPGIPSFPLPYIPPRCKTCGAELGDEELHEQWHDDLDKRILDLQMEIAASCGISKGMVK